MATANSTSSVLSGDSPATAQSYQQAMQNLNAVVVANPQSGVVVLQPAQLVKVDTQAGQHYKVRRGEGSRAHTPDNVIAVRHGDALHLRYADGSNVSFENFYTVCTDGSVCSVSVANDNDQGIALSGADSSRGVVADDGLLVYAHGNPEVLMAMAQGQSSLTSAMLALDEGPVAAYFAPDNQGAAFALGALAMAALARSNSSSGAVNGSTALGGETAAAAQQRALAAINSAADKNTATDTSPAASVYAAAGVSGVNDSNLASINSALNSDAVTGALTENAAEVQAIVDAYSAILASADGKAGNTTTALTAAQYAAVGVTGVSGLAAPGNTVFLLDNVVDGKNKADVDTEPELQALADAAAHLLAAAGGSAVDIAALTLDDLKALGVTGVNPDNLPAVLAAIGKTTPDTDIDTLAKIQTVASAAEAAAATALGVISTAAQGDTASASTPSFGDYQAAGVSGVSADNQAALVTALNSKAVDAAATDTTAEVQAIVNAYNAILASADGRANNTATPLTGAQFTAVGVTGLNGVSAPGNALHLLDSVVDASAKASVDTVSELQAMATAAAHVISAAAGGAAPSLEELKALGITGVTVTNLATVQAAIAATADNGTGVDTQEALQTVATNAIAEIPIITSTLGGVGNLDVSSNLVFSASQGVTVGAGFIHITDLGGSNGGTGYQVDTNTNTQNIDVVQAFKDGYLTISGSGANTRIVINPQWDLDLSSNYKITMDDGVFLSASGSHAPATNIAPVSFSTVTPGTHSTGTVASEAVASQTMNDSTGALGASLSWLNIQGIGNNTGSVMQLGDLSGGAYALVMKNYATERGGSPLLGGNGSDGIVTRDANVGVTNFGANDLIYFDSQVNNSATQFFDGRYSTVREALSFTGGLSGQSALVMGLVSSPVQLGSSAQISLGFEGNTAGTYYNAIYSLPDGTVGWANKWHPATPPVVMG